MILADAAGQLLSFGGIDSKSGMLTDVLGAFTRFMATGAQKIVDTEAEICGYLLALQYLRALLKIGTRVGTVSDSLLMFIGAAAWYHLTRNSVAAVQAYLAWMGSMASAMSGGWLDGDIMHDPSKFTQLGLQAWGAMLDQALNMDGFSVKAFIAAFVFFLVGFILFLGFIAMGFAVVLVAIRQSLEVTLGLALLPFMLDVNTRFLAQRGLALIVDAGIKLGAMAIAAGFSYGFLKEIHLSPTPTFRDGINLALAACLCAVISGGAAKVQTAASAAINGFSFR